MIKIVHTADTHFGVENYGKLDSKTGLHSRLLDFQASFNQIIDFAINESSDLFLFCGDAYKTAYPTPTQQKLFIQSLMKLYNAKIPVAIIVGNHDHPLSFGKANSLDIFGQLPLDGFHVFSKPNNLKIETKKGPIQIVGIPWPIKNNLVAKEKFHLKSHEEITTYISNTVSQIIKTFADKLDPKIQSIIAVNLTFSSVFFSGSEKTAVFGKDPVFLPSQLAIEPFDYVALGHLHRHQNLNPKGYPAIVYSGSPERIDFGERKEAKGFCNVLIDTKQQKKRCSFKFIKLKTRPMIQVEVKLKTKSETDGQTQTEQILEKLNKSEETFNVIDIKDSILKILYHVPEGKTDKIDLMQIQQACKSAMQLVSITPIIKHPQHERRANLKVDMDLKTLISKYLETPKSKRTAFPSGRILIFDGCKSRCTIPWRWRCARLLAISA